MKEPRPARSLACAEASRRNGALSKGPKTALGKLRASRSSRKHGLFRTSLLTGAGLPAADSDLEGLLAQVSTDWLDLASPSQLVRVAGAQLAESTRLLEAMREELDHALAGDESGRERLAALLRDITRMARYQRRFRGKRDRALRRLMDAAALRV